jgi:UDP-N-acetylmuramoylalanine--D-glutamate ligase
MEELKGKKISVLGLGMEGKDVAKYLTSQGIDVVVHDQKPREELDVVDIDLDRVEFVCGENYLDNLSNYDYIFRSPGIYRYKPELVAAEQKGVVITGQIKLFFSLCPGKIIGVTGTKGKGTTSTLIYNILKEAGYDIYLAGNIGKPCLEMLRLLNKDSWIVLELSSFQLIDMEQSPHIAVVLNITSDHMDWHASLQEYIDAKKHIVLHQADEDFAIINIDYDVPFQFSELGAASKYFFSRRKAVKGSFVHNKTIIRQISKREIIGSTDKLQLRGEHNWENITAAITAATLAGADIESIQKAVFSFKGLEHRLELVAEVNGISFYNDSFATGPQPTAAAVKSFTESETLILGGYDKGLEYSELIDAITHASNISAILLIGDMGPKIEGLLKVAGYTGIMEYLGKPSMKVIVHKAVQVTPLGGVVILSPAAASFDMFKDYKDRGNQFKEQVRQLL